MSFEEYSSLVCYSLQCLFLWYYYNAACSACRSGTGKNDCRVICAKKKKNHISYWPNIPSYGLCSRHACRLTAQTPAREATRPPEIIIGRTPLVLLKTMPLNPPAAIVLKASCSPRRNPISELMQLYVMATTPALLPRNGPRLVMALRTALSRSLGGWPADLRRPSWNPHTPPIDSAVR